MKINTNIPIEVGYGDPTNILPFNSYIQIHPYEQKILKLYVYGTDLKPSSILTLEAQVEELSESTEIKICFSKTEDASHWTYFDSKIIEDENCVPFYVSIKNNYYKDTAITLNLFIAIKDNSMTNTLENYGQYSPTTYKNIPNRNMRILSIVPSTDKRFLMYTGTGSLVLLDNNKAISTGDLT